MKLVEYLYRKFIPIFIGAVAFFVMMLSLTDLFINLWNYVSKAVPIEKVGLIMLYYLPKTVWYSIPIGVLFAVAYTLSDLYAKNELTAIFASGISLSKFTSPFLIFAFALSIGMLFFDDRVVVPTYAKKQEMQRQVLLREKSLNNSSIVIMSEGGNVIYKVGFYEDKLQRLSDVLVIFRDKNKSLEAIVYADGASWQNNSWVLNGEKQYTMTGTIMHTGPVEDTYRERMVERPETFRNNTINVEEVNIKEAKAYIEHLQKAGLPSGEARSLYYKKFSFPFVVFIVVFLAIGLSGKTRKNVLLVSLALSISAVVLFYIMQMITMLMAKFGFIPPVFGAWFPVIFFIIASIVLLKYART